MLRKEGCLLAKRSRNADKQLVFKEIIPAIAFRNRQLIPLLSATGWDKKLKLRDLIPVESRVPPQNGKVNLQFLLLMKRKKPDCRICFYVAKKGAVKIRFLVFSQLPSFDSRGLFQMTFFPFHLPDRYLAAKQTALATQSVPQATHTPYNSQSVQAANA